MIVAALMISLACGQGPAEPPAKIDLGPWREVGRPDGQVEYLLEFPSPITSPSPSNNLVPVRLLVPDPSSSPLPVVLILHYWGAADLRAERALAAELTSRGVAAAIMTLPYHLSRTPPGRRSGEMAIEPDPVRLEQTMTQAALDARRAIDAIQAFPGIDPTRIGLAGTSLGAVVAALVYAVDVRVKDVAFVVGGIDLASILWNSSRVVEARDRLRRDGYSEERLREALVKVEPGTYLPRTPPGRAFVITARYDTVVPPSAAEALISKLEQPVILRLSTGHYGGIFVQRRILREVATFFATEFAGNLYRAPSRLVAPTIRLAAKADIGLGFNLGVGLDLLRLDSSGRSFASVLLTPRGVQLFGGTTIMSGLAIGVTASVRGFGVGLLWSAIL